MIPDWSLEVASNTEIFKAGCVGYKSVMMWVRLIFQGGLRKWCERLNG